MQLIPSSIYIVALLENMRTGAGGSPGAGVGILNRHGPGASVSLSVCVCVRARARARVCTTFPSSINSSSQKTDECSWCREPATPRQHREAEETELARSAHSLERAELLHSTRGFDTTAIADFHSTLNSSLPGTEFSA